MADGAFPFAIRELRTTFGDVRMLVALLCTGVMVGLAGPFDTFDLMATLPRMAYWIGLVFLTYAVGNFVSALVQHILYDRIPATLPRFAIAGVAMGPPIFAVIAAINYASFGFVMDTPAEVLVALFHVTVISVVISVLFALFLTTDAPADTAPPAILDRLPFDKRGPLVALSVSDHYVNVMTTKGQDMVLMRLADAMRETGDVAGLQVHRSHWVALDQITAVKRQGDRAELTLSTGATIPVSRANMPALRKAGLLPRPTAHG
ncbi:LytTR family DNA-binding domain-containing protein [Yoonia sp. R2331]|uniref:LytTR family DNA-binding domain-containing protein n=1 Tax=Yoonia sp. R2331 TaxID=3237238 RepID=UPI0034E4691F